jgi:hypothetical protein
MFSLAGYYLWALGIQVLVLLATGWPLVLFCPDLFEWLGFDFTRSASYFEYNSSPEDYLAVLCVCWLTLGPVAYPVPFPWHLLYKTRILVHPFSRCLYMYWGVPTFRVDDRLILFLRLFQRKRPLTQAIVAKVQAIFFGWSLLLGHGRRLRFEHNHTLWGLVRSGYQGFVQADIILCECVIDLYIR